MLSTWSSPLVHIKQPCHPSWKIRDFYTSKSPNASARSTRPSHQSLLYLIVWYLSPLVGSISPPPIGPQVVNIWSSSTALRRRTWMRPRSWFTCRRRRVTCKTKRKNPWEKYLVSMTVQSPRAAVNLGRMRGRRLVNYGEFKISYFKNNNNIIIRYSFFSLNIKSYEELYH